jgi:hypothetical protein
MEPSPKQKLDGKVMGYEGWEILDVSENQFEQLTF